ncbi:MAG: hypothetical protein LBT79_06620, partial [Elusimicrobiota bacterium]|nr:hypothetical protein [Elusimicrobiota bacterium]
LLSIWLIAAKRYDDIKSFAISLVCGFGVNILFFPRVINNILQTGRGKQSFIQLFVFKDFYNDFIRYSNIIDRSIFNFTVKIWIFLLFLLFLIYLLRKCLKNSFTFSDETAIFNLPNIIGNIANLFYCPKTLKINAYSYKIIFTIAASFLYLLIIVKIAPYKADRYISLIFPSIVISFLSLIYVCVFNNAYKFRFININKNSLKYICLIFITFSIVIIGFFKEPKLHLYHYDKYKSLSFSKLYKGSQIIHTNNSWIIYADIFRWFEYDDIFIMDEDDNLISKIKDISGDLENLKTIIVHVDYPLKKEFIKTVNDLGYEIKFFYKGVYRFTPKQNKG